MPSRFPCVACDLRATVPSGSDLTVHGGWCMGRGQRLVLNLDFPLQRSQMDLLKLRQQPGASVVLGMGKTLSSEGPEMSLSCPSLDPELELTFLSFKDFSAPLFCSIIKRH